MVIVDEHRLYQCCDCSYTSANSRNMVNHIESKHVTTAGAQCQVCKKICPTREALRKHVSRSHRVKVNVDGGSLTWNLMSSAKMHCAINIEIPVILLGIQVYIFSSWIVLDVAADIEELKRKIYSKIVPLPNGHFKCSDCDYTSKYRANLPKHIECRHISLPGLVCNICQKVYPTRESLRRHVQRHADT